MSTSRGLFADPISIGMWNPEAAANIKNVLSINRKPIDYTKDQMIQLYLMLYPFIAADFSHRHDLLSWAMKQLEELKEKYDELNDQFETLKNELDQHKHIGNMGSPTSPASAIKPFTQIETEAWETLPEDQEYKFGESLVTGSSTYSDNIDHRRPIQDSTDVKRKTGGNVQDISQSYREQLQDTMLMVPFDVGGNQIDEEDEFANRSPI